MITKAQFVPGKTYIYSDMYDKSYAIIQAIAVVSTRKNGFSFTAKIIDNSHLTGQTTDFNANGTIHTYSNSFIYRNLQELKQGSDAYKKTLVAYVKRQHALGL